jgi:hypothetical protein
MTNDTYVLDSALELRVSEGSKMLPDELSNMITEDLVHGFKTVKRIFPLVDYRQYIPLPYDIWIDVREFASTCPDRI